MRVETFKSILESMEERLPPQFERKNSEVKSTDEQKSPDWRRCADKGQFATQPMESG